MTDFDATAALAPLKPFQRATVDHTIRRLLTDHDSVRQFLVADEVGLGKTMVARGVIARIIEMLQHTVPRLDIVYICSNGAIARQNVAKLDVLGGGEAKVLPTRLTLLALELMRAGGIRKKGVNFFSLTPGTSLYLTSGGGTKEERALIRRMIWPMVTQRRAVTALFQGYASKKGWRNTRARMKSQPVEPSIEARFRQALAHKPDLIAELEATALAFRGGGRHDSALRRRRDRLIGALRGLLAEISAAALEPDLIILDEFQRFQDLLKDQSAAAALARLLFDHKDDAGNEARTLLLSATPYRILSLADDDAEAGDHYTEFMEVIEFLYGPERGPYVRETLEAEMRRFRRAILRLPEAEREAMACKHGIERDLRGVIARTERVSETRAADAMVRDVPVTTDIFAEDLREARAVARIAAAVGAPHPVNYWKSAPWLLSFMRDYDLARRIEAHAEAPPPALAEAMTEANLCQIDTDAIEAYAPITPANGRMRALMDIAFSEGLGERLWMPPTLPYAGPRNVASKTLVFSQWAMVPDAIAGVLSYEAERRMGMGGAHSYSHLPKSRPLKFRRTQERLAGLRALQLVIPSPTLAALTDPLRLVRASGPFEDPRALRAAADSAVREVAQAMAVRSVPAREETWDWAAAASLDLAQVEGFGAWLSGDADQRAGVREDGAEAWHDHLAALAEAGRTNLQGTPNAAGLCAHLATVGLGSPASCALRALSRVVDLPLYHPAMLSAATKVGKGFLTLFNMPETQALLRRTLSAEGGREVYWRAVMQYCSGHDLQAVLDEYAHQLVEAEGLLDALPERAVARIAEVMVEALSIHPAQIDLKGYSLENGRIAIEPRLRLRGRFATRLAARGARDEAGERTDIIRTAFNAPFRPFVLATTSVGQEGLDFHPWCHRVVHWNLPTNPVDLEQREGRVHRYKNHAVRLNLARAFGPTALTGAARDPWNDLFRMASERCDRTSLLDPFWLFDGDQKIDRVVLTPAFSREASRLGQLKRSVATYRLVFGQPRQDDLIAWLNRLEEGADGTLLADLKIDLRPRTV